MIKGLRTSSEDDYRSQINSDKSFLIYMKPFMLDHLEPASYDVSVGDYAFMLTRMAGNNTVCDPVEEPEKFLSMVNNGEAINIKEARSVVIPSQESVLIRAREVIGLPNVLTALVTTKVKYAFEGVMSLTSRIDPGYCGKLLIPVFNLGGKDIELSLNDKLANIIFIKLMEPVSEGKGFEDDTRKQARLHKSEVDPKLLTEDELLRRIQRYGGPFALASELLKRYLKHKQTTQP